MKNRRGSFTVQIVMLFCAMLILIWAVLTAAKNLAISSTAEDFGRLWGTSILAEYDRNLKDRYGLFGFYGNEAAVEEKLDMYAEYTFGEKKYIEYGGTSCNLKDTTLANPAQVKRQMEEAVIFGCRPHGLHRSDSAGTAGSRAITSRWILDSLPSAGESRDINVTGLAAQIKSGKGLSAILGSSMVNQYIFTYFQHNRSTGDMGDTYFRNEIEYILSGRPDDETARKKVREKLVVLRNILNLAYLYTCPEKREAAMTLAAAMTPGPEAVITQGVLLELWAFAEAENDVRILTDDKKVPLMKSDSTWALTLENAMEQTGDSEKKYISPPVWEGQNYETYLRILLNGVSEQTRLLRSMDLIQINLKYLYCDYFLLEDYHTGLQFSMRVNGEEHEFQETYERAAEEEKTEQEKTEQDGQLSG